jgi:hypothetical protein
VLAGFGIVLAKFDVESYYFLIVRPGNELFFFMTPRVKKVFLFS